LEKGLAPGFKSGNIVWLAVGAGWVGGPGESSLPGLAFSLWLCACNACELSLSEIWRRAKKNSKRCLTGSRGSVTKTVAAAGGAELTEKIHLDSGKKVFIIQISGICSLKTK